MNFDLEDGKPPVSFTLRTEDAERFMAFMAECQNMEIECKTLRHGLRLANDRIAELERRSIPASTDMEALRKASRVAALREAAEICKAQHVGSRRPYGAKVCADAIEAAIAISTQPAAREQEGRNK